MIYVRSASSREGGEGFNPCAIECEMYPFFSEHVTSERLALRNTSARLVHASVLSLFLVVLLRLVGPTRKPGTTSCK